jgi:ATP-binding cassette subfamily F protein uup
MDRLVDHLFVFEGDGVVSDFPGNYSQYRESLRAKEMLQSETLKPEPPKQQSPLPSKKKLSYKEQREFDLLEKEIKDLEAEKNSIQEQLSSSGLPYEKVQKLSSRISEITELIDTKEFRWLELSEAVS